MKLERKLNLLARLSGRRVCEVDMLIVHKKTGNIYTVIADNAIDCTNERDGTQVVVYCNPKGMWFVREAKEFWQKFEKKELKENDK